jgi:hypothetical protein
MQCSFEQFEPLFAMLLSVTGKSDESGLLAIAYYELLSPTDPTHAEIWHAISAHIDNHHWMPTGRALKELIWDARKAGQQALPPANPASLRVEASRENRLTAIAAIYKHQGDTKFYRAVLASKEGVWSTTIDPRGTVSHENVLAFIEGDEVGSRQAVIA